MFEIKVLSKEDVAKAIKIPQIINVVEDVYKSKSENLTEVWPTVFYEFEPGKADMDIKSGYIKSNNIFGHKTVTWFADNKDKSLPTLTGIINIFDATTGIPLGITDASYITGARTGAAGALGAKYLARENSKNLLIIGAGNQAIFQIGAILTLLPNIEKIQVAALNLKEAKNFLSNINKRLQDEFEIDSKNIVFEAVENLQVAVETSDIIITITPSRSPIIKKEWVQKGTHISCIGADMVGKQEIDSEILSSAIIFVDDLIHCMHVGEIEIPLKEGIITEKNIIGELGDLILGKVKGRTSDEQITVFDSTGMALLDIAVAEIALKFSKENNLGIKSKI